MRTFVIELILLSLCIGSACVDLVETKSERLLLNQPGELYQPFIFTLMEQMQEHSEFVSDIVNELLDKAYPAELDENSKVAIEQLRSTFRQQKHTTFVDQQICERCKVRLSTNMDALSN